MVLGYSKIREGIKTMEKKAEVESIVREIKRRTRKKYSSEEKIRIVLEGLRGEESIALTLQERRNKSKYVL